MHCDDPTCAPVCATDAIKKTEDGVVQSSLKPRCIACSNCELACPFGIPKVMIRHEQMMKCDMCYNRTSAGKRPMCATVCPSQALAYVPAAQMARDRREKATNVFFLRKPEGHDEGVHDGAAWPRFRLRRRRGLHVGAGGTRLWREESSIETADERYVTRRQFGRFLVLMSLGMFVGNLWILARSLWRRDAPPVQALIGRADEVRAGSVRLFRYPGPEDPCLLFHTADGRFVAYSQKCTHLSCAVFRSTDGERLECPCHEGYFSMRDGRVLQGPPPRPLPTILLERRGEELWAIGVDPGIRARASSALRTGDSRL